MGPTSLRLAALVSVVAVNAFNLLRFHGNRQFTYRRYSTLAEREASSSSLFTSSISSPANAVIAPALKAMVFIDGTWLYYTLIEGRDNCPIQRRFGMHWKRTHRVDYRRLTQLVASQLRAQILEQTKSERVIDIVRTSVFTSTREDTDSDSWRLKMIADFFTANFEVHRYSDKVNSSINIYFFFLFLSRSYISQVFDGRSSGEVCGHLSRGGDALHGHRPRCLRCSLPYAASSCHLLILHHILHILDVACIVTGDKDFIPAMQKTRLKGKRVALVSMRNSCNRDLSQPELSIRDFNVIWLDDFIDEYILPITERRAAQEDVDALVSLLRKALEEGGGTMSSRDLGKMLQSSTLAGKRNALSVLKEFFVNLRSFVSKQRTHFECSAPSAVDKEFLVSLRQGGQRALREEDKMVTKSSALGLVSSSPNLVLSLSEKDIRETFPNVDFGAELSTFSSQDKLRLILSQKPDEEEGGNGDDHDDDNGIMILKQMKKSVGGEEWDDMEDHRRVMPRDVTLAEEDDAESSENAVLNLVQFHLQVSGADVISSRELGRYLQTQSLPSGQTLLMYVKSNHGSLRSFIQRYPDVFTVTATVGVNEFFVGLVDQVYEEEEVEEVEEEKKELLIPSVESDTASVRITNEVAMEIISEKVSRKDADVIAPKASPKKTKKKEPSKAADAVKEKGSTATRKKTKKTVVAEVDEVETPKKPSRRKNSTKEKKGAEDDLTNAA